MDEGCASRPFFARAPGGALYRTQLAPIRFALGAPLLRFTHMLIKHIWTRSPPGFFQKNLFFDLRRLLIAF